MVGDEVKSLQGQIWSVSEVVSSWAQALCSSIFVYLSLLFSFFSPSPFPLLFIPGLPSPYFPSTSTWSPIYYLCDLRRVTTPLWLNFPHL